MSTSATVLHIWKLYEDAFLATDKLLIVAFSQSAGETQKKKSTNTFLQSDDGLTNCY